MRLIRYFFFLLFISFSAIADNTFTNFKLTPGWVQPAAFQTDIEIPTKQLKDGIYYSLVDKQIKASPQQTDYYSAYSTRIINKQGVREFSQINISFDPNYQQLEFHQLIIFRNGLKIDKTPTASFKLIQRETELDELIYNGEKSLNIVIDDVRVDDDIYYSYTIKGQNPVYKNIFSYSSNLNWSLPVNLLNLRVIWQKPTKLHYRYSNKHQDIVIESAPNSNEKIYHIVKHKIQPISIEDNTPNWFSPWTKIHFSEFDDWSGIAHWADQLYLSKYDENEELVNLVKQFKQQGQSRDEQIMLALRFVQDEIRYLGIEFGVNSHEPSLASETLKRRYGDCKDKTVLFISLLNRLGIEAKPALVNTEQSHQIRQRLPSINAFNHVITYIELNDKVYWLDPTRSNQHGELDNIYQPNYGYALLANNAAKQLTEMKVLDKHSGVAAYETYKIPAEQSAPIELRVESHYTGWKAASQRRTIESDGVSKLETDFLNYYKRNFDEVTLKSPLAIAEDNQLNQITYKEHYELTSFWQDEEERLVGYFNTSIISSYLDKPELLERTQPYSITFPIKLQQTFEVNFEEQDWAFENDEFTEKNEFFEFNFTSHYDKDAGKLLLKYKFQTLKKYVPAEKFNDYVQALARARENRAYSIQQGKTQQENPKPTEEPFVLDDSNVFWALLITLLLCYLILLIIWIVKISKKGKEPQYQLFQVSIPKLIFMNLTTLNLYSIYWFYKNYKYFQQEMNEEISPVWRSIFNSIWFYSLWKRVNELEHNSGQKKPTFILISAAVLFLLCAVAESSIESSLALIFSLIGTLLLVPIALQIIRICKQQKTTTTADSRFGICQIVLGLCFAVQLFISYSSETYLTPPNQVIAGDKLWRHDVKSLERREVITPVETIRMFYSNAYLFYSADGNGFTEKRVFSYWSEGNAFNFQSAEYSEIASIKTKWSEHDDETDTVVTITRTDGSDFFLYVSPTKEGDKKFVNELKSLWQTNSAIQ